MANKVLITGLSALEYWRHNSERHTKTTRAQTRLKTSRAPKIGETQAFLDERPYISAPLHVAVPTRADRRFSSLIKCHLAPNLYGIETTTATGALANSVPIDMRFSVIEPALILGTLASDFPFPKVVELGCALCGHYFPTTGDDFVLRRQPLTTRQAIERRLDVFVHTTAINRLRRASPLILEGAASTAETLLALLLTMPRTLGGYGLPRPALNHIITTRLGTTSDASVSPDLLWEEKRLIVEYDSQQYHAADEAIERDAWRRNLISNEGYNVITVTRDQLRNPDRFAETAAQIARKLGVRLRITETLRSRTRQLRHELFPSADAPWRERDQ